MIKRIKTTSHPGQKWPMAPVLVCALLFMLFSVGAGLATERVGDATCAECHEDLTTMMSENAHGKFTREPGFVCESCHGPGAAHVDSQDPADIYNPATDYVSTEKSPCLSCHMGAQFESLMGQAHYEVGEGCSDCHQVHSQKAKLLKQPVETLCASCHRDVSAQFNLTSHHPVPEGLMSCVSCHQVHGGAKAHATSNENRELCLTCHSSKEGPFVYEHQPVNEDCGICHTPHGSVADNLLVQNEPALCMSCHYMHFHTSLAGFVGDFSDPLNSGRGGTSSLQGFKASMLTKCTQCHVEIHGSDLPSQGISSQGKSLTR